MSARKRRWRPTVKSSATHLSPAAAKQPSNAKRSAAAARDVAVATRLPASLERRLTEIEARLVAVEQLTICPLACSPSCAFRCPTEGGAA